MRVALYGGTFDPVHNGHLGVARALRGLFALDEVLFIPAHVAPHKRGRRVTGAIHRHAMLALATQDETAERVSTIELDDPERPYTIETIERVRAGTDAREWRTFFIMGADSWSEIETWHEWQRLLDLTDVIVVTRPGFELTRHTHPFAASRELDVRGVDRNRVAQRLAEHAAVTRVYLTDAVEIEIAATEVRREACDNLKDIRRATTKDTSEIARRLTRYVPRSVADYIAKYELYKDEHGT